MNPERSIETEKLVRSWARHEASWLRDYLVAGVEDPRLNLQSILSRQFVIRSLAGDQFEALMNEEHRFAAVMDWLIRVAALARDRDGRDAMLYALRRGSDNAEGMEIPRFVLQTFTKLPREADGCALPNYIESWLSLEEGAPPSDLAVRGVLETFASAWNTTLGLHFPAPAQGIDQRVSLLEPACGSANDYRYLDRFGLGKLLDYTGFDLSPKNIQNARDLFPGTRFETGNVFEIAAPPQSFDLCVVHDLFEHLSPEGLHEAVSEVCRVTRRGIGIGFFQMDEIPDHQVRPVEEYHWNLLSLARMKELFAGHGFVGWVVHVGSFLERQFGYALTHNPKAYSFFLMRKGCTI